MVTSFEVGGRLHYFIKYKILGFIGLLILVLTVYVAIAVYHNSTTNPLSASQDLVIFVSLVMMYVGFLILRVVPTGHCPICGRTNVEVATQNGVDYCNRCYESGAAQAYFAGMERQSRESERAQPPMEERPQPPPQVKEIIKEREVIHRETIVKIRCGHCHRLFEEEKGSCPYCGAPV